MKIESIELFDERLERMWAFGGPSWRYASPDRKYVACFSHEGEIRMGLSKYSLHLETPLGRSSESEALKIPGYDKYAITCPDGPYQPWTHDGSSLLVSFHKTSPVLFEVRRQQLKQIAVKKDWFANISCSHSIPFAFLCSRYSWILASRKPENAYFISLEGNPAPVMKFSLPYETWYAWWLEDGEHLLLFLQDSKERLARLQLLTPTSLEPVMELDIFETISSALPYDQERFERLKSTDQLCFEERLWVSAIRLKQWGPASYERETGTLSLCVIVPTDIPVRKHAFWGRWTCSAALKRIEIKVTHFDEEERANSSHATFIGGKESRVRSGEPALPGGGK